MGTGMELLVMPKPKGRPKTSERDDVTVKIDRALVGMAKLIATRQGTTVAELLSEMLKAPLDRAYGQMLRELEADKR
jgi:hypothetical protein